MKLQDLFEAISQTIYLDAWRQVEAAMKNWAKEVGVPGVQSIVQPFDDKIAALPEPTDRWDDPVSDKRNNLQSNSRDAVENALHNDSDLSLELTEKLKHRIEVTLQNFARDYIETKLGKIVPFDAEEYRKTGDFNAQTAKRHYFLQHIIVQLQTNGKYEKSGAPKTKGGYFDEYPGKDKIDTAYTRTKMKWGDELAVAINIYISQQKLSYVTGHLILDRIENETFGEALAERNEIQDFLKSIMTTFTHETVHLEQTARARLSGKFYRPHGITHIPDPNRSRPLAQAQAKDSSKGSDRKNKDAAYRKYQPGKRGNPDHLGSEEYSDAAFVDYLGTAHEIEAHAAGAAGAIIGDMLDDRFRRNSGQDAVDRQIEINRHVDEVIQSLRSGDRVGGSSMESYRDYIQDRITQMDRALKIPRKADGTIDTSRARYPLDKIDTLHRKVWRLFMTKLVKHLQAYKKPIPWKYEDDYRKEYHPEPRAAKIGGIMQKPKVSSA